MYLRAYLVVFPIANTNTSVSFIVFITWKDIDILNLDTGWNVVSSFCSILHFAHVQPEAFFLPLYISFIPKTNPGVTANDKTLKQYNST